MKKTILLTVLIALIAISGYTQVAINETGAEPDISAILDLQSTTKGFLVPRVTTNQRNNIGSPQGGLLVYDNQTESFWYYNNTLGSWVEIGSGAQNINDLTDAKTDTYSVFLGSNAGSIDDGNNFNSALGVGSLEDNTSGDYNTATGYASLNANTIGTYNTAVGSRSMYSNETGAQNTAVGSQSLYYTKHSDNTAIGYAAGRGNPGESFTGCVFIGNEAGRYNSEHNKLYIDNSWTSTPLIGGDFSANHVDINGTIKIAGGSPGIGKVLTSDADGAATWESLSSAMSINDLSDATNIGTKLFMGTDAGINNSGDNNTGIGYEALKTNTSGVSNTALGYKSLTANTSGNGNTAFGSLASSSNTIGFGNTAIGTNAIYTNTSGMKNTSVGNGSLYYTASGHYNTAIGYNAGEGNTGESFSGCVFLGYEAGKNNSDDNMLYIDNSSTSTPLIGGDFTANRVDINGTIKITGGSPESGKMLTSDADGNASWDRPSIDELSDVVNSGTKLFIGTDAGLNNTGTYNTGIGYEAMKTNTIGTHNTALGFKSMTSNTEGENNTAFGHGTLQSNTTGDNNTVLGKSALTANTTGYDNTGIGKDALINSTIGYCNTAIGTESMYSNIDGNFNTAIGTESMYSNIDGTTNTAIGYMSLHDNTEGFSNTAIGYQSLYKSTNGYANTATGYESLYENTTGKFNTAIGYRALNENEGGDGNTAIGNNALIYQTDGDYNTALGHRAFQHFIDISNSMALGYSANIIQDNSVRIGNNDIVSIGGMVGWSTLSDGRFKTNVKEEVHGLDFILKLRPVNYQVDKDAIDKFTGMKVPKDFRKEHLSQVESGFIAQEVEQVANELGFEFSGVDAPQNPKSHYGLRYGQFVVPLVKAVQEQQEMIKDLQDQNTLLLKRLEKLEAKLN